MEKIQLSCKSTVIEADYYPHKRIVFEYMGYSVRVCKPYGAENKNGRGYNAYPLIELNTVGRSAISTDIWKLEAIREFIMYAMYVLNAERDGFVIPSDFNYTGDPINNNTFVPEIPENVRKLQRTKVNRNTPQHTVFPNNSSERTDRGARSRIHLPNFDWAQVKRLNPQEDGECVYFVCIDKNGYYTIPLGWGRLYNMANGRDECASTQDQYHYIRIAPIADVNPVSFRLKDFADIIRRRGSGSFSVTRKDTDRGIFLSTVDEVPIVSVIGTVNMSNDVVYYLSGVMNRAFKIK